MGAFVELYLSYAVIRKSVISFQIQPIRRSITSLSSMNK